MYTQVNTVKRFVPGIYIHFLSKLSAGQILSCPGKMHKYRKWSIKSLDTWAFAFYFTISSEITNFDSGVLCYLHRGNLIKSGLYLPQQNALVCKCLPFECYQDFVFFLFVSSTFCFFCFPFCRRWLRPPVTLCSLLNDLLTTMPAVRYMKIEPAIVSWKIPPWRLTPWDLKCLCDKKNHFLFSFRFWKCVCLTPDWQNFELWFLSKGRLLWV